MADYVREQSVGELLRNGAEIYRGHFLTVFASYFVLALPLGWLAAEASIRGQSQIFVALLSINVVLASVAAAAVTIAVSNVCVGNRTDLGQAYKSLGVARALKVLWTSLVAGMSIGLLMVIVFGAFALSTNAYTRVIAVVLAIAVIFLSVMFYAGFLIVVPIVVLEDCAGFPALRRCWTLSRGLRVRNLGVIFLLFAIFLAFNIVIQFIMAPFADRISDRLVLVITFGLQFLVTPMILVLSVLLYYDSRVRLEGYDTSALSTDLRH